MITIKREMIDRYVATLPIVLEILGHPEALVSDEADVGDFLYQNDFLADLSEIFGIDVRLDTKIWQLAQAIDIEECNKHIEDLFYGSGS